MSGRTRLAVLLTTLAAMLALAAPALGLTVSVDNPDSAYLARTSKIDIGYMAEESHPTSATDGYQTITFSRPMRKITTQNVSWGQAGQVEDPGHPPLLNTFNTVDGSYTDVTWDFDLPVYEFGFEASPDVWDLARTITAEFVILNDGQVIDTISKTITVTSSDYNFNARLFAIRSDVPFDEVRISLDNGPRVCMAQLRYSETPPPLVEVSGVVKSAISGVCVPFARVWVEHDGGVVAQADADYQGRYSTALLPGDYSFVAGAPGWAQSSEDVTVPESTPCAQDLVLTDHHEQAVYRFFNMKGGVHFYTASDAEFVNVYTNLDSVFKYDGIAYFVDLDNTDGQVPLYRFFNRETGVHFFTASEAEKNNVIANLSGRYTFEGQAYGVRIDGVGVPVYRFYVPARNAHFYTADTSEILAAGSGLSNYYHYEGVAFYVGGTY